jgi:hypothetical protein
MPACGVDLQPPSDPMKITVPDLLSRMYGRNALVTFKEPNTLALNWSKVSSGLGEVIQ